MKSLSLLSTFLATASAAVLPLQPVSYEGHKVFRVAVGNNVDRVNQIVEKLNLQTWKAAKKAGVFADIVVQPAQLDAFTKATKGLETTVMHENLGAAIANETSSIQAFDDVSIQADETWFKAYHPYKDHLTFLNELQSQYSANSQIVTSGNSLGGNAITGIHFWGSSGKGKKPAIVFHGNVHAREWITGITVEYFAYQLLSKYATDAEIKGFVDKYDFIFFPVVNPDGFIYTQTTNRMWRKNRQTTAGSSCLGHDINRNWNYKWDVRGGASTNPCAEDFKGVSPADAPETKALADFLAKTKAAQGLKLFIDWHSYSQLFLTPYGYSCDAVAPNNNEIQSLAKGATDALRAVHGTAFRYGPICDTIYQATGSSVDYVFDVVKADYSFTLELRDTGRYGFVLPAEQILPTGQESFAAVKYLLKNMK